MLRNFRIALFLTARSFTRGNKAIIAAPIVLMALIYINVLFIPSLIHGALQQIDNNVINKLSSDIVIVAKGSQPDLAISKEVIDKISATDGVKAVTGTYQVAARIANANYSAAWQLVGIDPATYGSVFSNSFTEGALLEESDRTDIVIGATIAGNNLDESDATFRRSLHGASIGENIQLQIQNAESSNFTIKGIIDDKFMLSNQRAFITRDALQLLLPNATNKYTALHIKLTNNSKTDQTVSVLSQIVPEYTVLTSKDYAVEVREQAKTTKKINTILSGFSFIVVAIIIFIVTYIDLVNRRKQIGIERAIGIANASIVITYLLRAILCTLLGILFGGIIYLFVMLPYSEAHPFSFPSGPVSLVYQSGILLRYALGLLVIATMGAIIPAIRAVKVSILDALRS